MGVLASGIDWTWQVIGWDSKSYLEVCSCLDGVQKGEMLHIWEASLMASCIGASFFWWGGVTAYVGQCLFSPWILRGTGNTPGFPVGTQHWQGSANQVK